MKGLLFHEDVSVQELDSQTASREPALKCEDDAGRSDRLTEPDSNPLLRSLITSANSRQDRRTNAVSHLTRGPACIVPAVGQTILSELFWVRTGADSDCRVE